MRWTFEQMLSYVSIDEDVFPGDVYGSGTVSGGCGLEHGRMLAPGDVVELSAPGFGTLRNRVATRD
jgi:2-keto-4-pentenoate hydratase/2-oxohepta-3-ene-1,7-dioic acid hydratase in catechol pathway